MLRYVSNGFYIHSVGAVFAAADLTAFLVRVLTIF